MRLLAFSTILLVGSTVVEALPATTANALPTDLSGIISKYKKYVDTTLADSKKTCNKKTVQVRKEW
jgi:hypothetical protein